MVSIPIQYKKLMNLLPYNKTQNYTKFIILCHPRSGSGLLNSLLNNHLEICSLGEAIVSHSNDKSQKSTPFTEYLKKNVFTKKHLSIKAVGIKFFYEHTEKAPDFVDFILKDKTIKVIILARKDILRGYTSWMIATRTSKWLKVKHSDNLKLNEKKTYISPNLFKKYKTLLKNDFEFFQKALENHKTVNVFYEDLVADADKELNKVFHLLNVKPTKLKSLFQKQNPEKLEDLIENYSEVAELNEYLHL